MRRTIILARLFISLVVSGLMALPGLWIQGRKGGGHAQAALLQRAGRWGRRSVQLGRGRVALEGLEKIPTEGPVLYVANHQGALDIPILMGHLPGAPGFVAKKELFDIPVLGYWMRRIGCVPLDRENPRAARKQIMLAAESVKQGRRLVIFPEGTRSRDPEGRMGPFRRGSMKLALVSGAVVVPITVEGSRFLMSSEAPDGFDGTVKVVVGDPIHVEALDEEAKKALPDVVHNLIDRTRVAHHMGGISERAVAP